MSTDYYVVDQKLVFILGDADKDVYYGRNKSEPVYNKKYYDIEIHLFDLRKYKIEYDPFYKVRDHFNSSAVRVYEHHPGSYYGVENYLNNGLGIPKIYLTDTSQWLNNKLQQRLQYYSSS